MRQHFLTKGTLFLLFHYALSLCIGALTLRCPSLPRMLGNSFFPFLPNNLTKTYFKVVHEL